MKNGHFRPPPVESTPLNRSTNNLSQVITSATSIQLRQIGCTSVKGGFLGKWVKYITILPRDAAMLARRRLQVKIETGSIIEIYDGRLFFPKPEVVIIEP